MVQQWRLKGSLYSTRESSGKIDPLFRKSRSFLSSINQKQTGIIFKDLIMELISNLVQSSGSLKGKEIFSDSIEPDNFGGSEQELNTRKEVNKIFGRQWEFHCLTSKGKSGGKGVSFLIATVYTSTSLAGKRQLWNFLQQHCNREVHMIVGGDFNCVLDQRDKKGGKPFVFNSMLRIYGIMLQHMVTREEVIKAVFNLSSNKTSGLDGITASFFKNYWDIVGKNVMEAILEIFSLGKIHMEWKDTLIVLIPKVNNAN
ncbi:hypothetical protein KFK09_004809 [Dendrobium nobile]|uniref:Reverse transcriptase n=1 Tax=Dendrobium nobile TaxID=94219 RepID=A0A8T3BTZ7_DENNO|nr:hypothetical protein KFK09_004809 [Dendrobium nobile]